MFRVCGVSQKRLQAYYFRDFQTEKLQEFKNFKNVKPVTNGQKFQSGIPD